ncbi:hypothetical protein GcC1_210052 [Golovinomyces cichoracearum]|uniref:Uncharacterized protein n=1 Tax=Golovinomyces cichoracearum TaxID=62708 RepID=A0A420HAP3_9PEZI|nr:hypothetical protein GcC1_210052 [Golovinomyces cichoracearum]
MPGITSLDGAANVVKTTLDNQSLPETCESSSIDHLNAPRIGKHEELRQRLYANIFGVQGPALITEVSEDSGSQKGVSGSD